MEIYRISEDQRPLPKKTNTITFPMQRKNGFDSYLFSLRCVPRRLVGEPVWYTAGVGDKSVSGERAGLPQER